MGFGVLDIEKEPHRKDWEKDSMGITMAGNGAQSIPRTDGIRVFVTRGFSGVDWCFRDSYDPVWNRSAQLIAEGVAVEERRLADTANLRLTATRCVVLTELDKPLLNNIAAQDFEALKHMLLYSSTLWLIRRGASIDSRTPELNMITGLSRTIQGEAPDIRLMTLGLDPDQDLEGSGATETVMKALRLQEDRHNTDHEFAQRDGAFQVLRICPDETLSGLLTPDDAQDTV
ncbi:hypothetical protein DL769_006019 [Monosporascus sp. CRB-8-3]|nr:hypothetical protein DL769_006019 [Monosporascus sp. CRB-8-3]